MVRVNNLTPGSGKQLYHTVVMHSNQMHHLPNIVVNGESHGTLFLAVPRPLGGRKRWILLQKPSDGYIVVNKKAETALNNDKSLYGTHIVSISGSFEADEAVRLLVDDPAESEEPREFGRAILNYSSKECEKLIGQHSDDFFDIVGYSGAESVAHRNNICLWIPGGEESNLADFPEINMESHPSVNDLSEFMADLNSDKPKSPAPFSMTAEAPEFSPK
jgi:glutamate 5-kinase